MAHWLMLDVRLSPEESMARLRGVVRRQSTFWISAKGCANPEPLMGHLGERTFRLFAGKRYSRAMPLFLTGDVAPGPHGSRVEARIGLRAWDVTCCVFCVALLTAAALGGCLLILASDVARAQKLASVLPVSLMWLMGTAALAIDCWRNRKDAPLLAQSLMDVFADVRVADRGRPPVDAGAEAPASE